MNILKKLYILIKFTIAWLYKNRNKLYISIGIWFLLKHNLIVPFITNTGEIIKAYLINPDIMQWVISSMPVVLPLVYKFVKKITKRKDDSLGTQ